MSLMIKEQTEALPAIKVEPHLTMNLYANTPPLAGPKDGGKYLTSTKFANVVEKRKRFRSATEIDLESP